MLGIFHGEFSCDNFLFWRSLIAHRIFTIAPCYSILGSFLTRCKAKSSASSAACPPATREIPTSSEVSPPSHSFLTETSFSSELQAEFVTCALSSVDCCGFLMPPEESSSSSGSESRRSLMSKYINNKYGYNHNCLH